MHVIAFIEARHATARALQGARREDPVRPAPLTERRDPPAPRPRRDLLRYVPARAR